MKKIPVITLEDMGFEVIFNNAFALLYRKNEENAKMEILFDKEKKEYCVTKEVYISHGEMWWIPEEESDSPFPSNGRWAIDNQVNISEKLHCAIHNKLIEVLKEVA